MQSRRAYGGCQSLPEELAYPKPWWLQEHAREVKPEQGVRGQQESFRQLIRRSYPASSKLQERSQGFPQRENNF